MVPADERGGETPRREAGQLAEAAALAAAIERWAGDLAIGEEPARFLASLDDGAR